MTPELRALVAQRAQELRGLLNASAVTGAMDLVAAAEAARRMFMDVADDVRVRWLNLEVAGYGYLVDQRPLHEVLGIHRHDRLVAHVAAYRAQQWTWLRTPEAGPSLTSSLSPCPSSLPPVIGCERRPVRRRSS